MNIRALLSALALVLLGMALAGVAALTLSLQGRPALSPWHEVRLDREFSARDASDVADLPAYLALETVLFAQLDAELMRDAPDGQAPGARLDRYATGSLVDATRFAPNWNRTFVLTAQVPRAAFLMLHGMSDSPYSMRALGADLHARGATVVGLRLPGHGTAPGALTQVRWQDFAAAVRLAMRSLRHDLPAGVPIHIVGYSNGAALAVNYSIEARSDDDLPRPAGLVLISPALRLAPGAGLAGWTRSLSALPGLEQLAWLSIQPEYDPYKYNSFPINAGDQTYRLTNEIGTHLDRLGAETGIADFPPVLAFQSAVDSTIAAGGVVGSLLARLAPDDHELVLFDINREAQTNAFFASDPHAQVEALFAAPRAFDLRLLTNRDPGTLTVMERRQPPAGGTEIRRPLDLAWPEGIFSLSHVSLPFRPDDPLYGVAPPRAGQLPPLGTIDLRGETGVLQVPLGQFLRLRYNPFYDYLLERITKRFLPHSETEADGDDELAR